MQAGDDDGEQTDIIELLLDAGADANRRTGAPEALAPLHVVASCASYHAWPGYLRTALVLLRRGAKVDALDAVRGATGSPVKAYPNAPAYPRHPPASPHRSRAIPHSLKFNRFSLHTPQAGRTPLHIVAEIAETSGEAGPLLRLLLESGAPVAAPAQASWCFSL